MSLPVSFIKQDNVEYEVVDKVARSSMSDKSRRIIIMGDSYNHSYDGDTESDVTSVGLRIKAKFPAHSNNIIDNWIAGGAGFIGKSGQYNFIEFLNANYATISDKSTVTDLLLFGGYNDIGQSTNDVINAVVAFCNRVNTLFPNCVVHLACVGWGTRSYLSEMQSIAFNVLRGYKLGAEKSQNCKYVKNSELILHNYAYCGADGVHPNDAGYDALAEKLGSYIINGNPIENYYINGQTTITRKAGISGSNVVLTVDRMNELTHIYCPTHFSWTGPAIANEGKIMIGTINKDLLWGFVRGSDLPSLRIPVSCAVEYTGGSLTQLEAILEFYGGNVNIDLPGFTNQTITLISCTDFDDVKPTILC